VNADALDGWLVRRAKLPGENAADGFGDKQAHTPVCSRHDVTNARRRHPAYSRSHNMIDSLVQTCT
jgi:hypothetical protein